MIEISKKEVLTENLKSSIDITGRIYNKIGRAWNDLNCKCDKSFCNCPVCEEHDLIDCPLCKNEDGVWPLRPKYVMPYKVTKRNLTDFFHPAARPPKYFPQFLKPNLPKPKYHDSHCKIHICDICNNKTCDCVWLGEECDCIPCLQQIYCKESLNDYDFLLSTKNCVRMAPEEQIVDVFFKNKNKNKKLVYYGVQLFNDYMSINDSEHFLHYTYYK